MPCLGRAANRKDRGQGHGHSSERQEHHGLHCMSNAACAEGCSRQNQLLLLLCSPISQYCTGKQSSQCRGASTVLMGVPRPHVKLELGEGSKLSLSHRLEWWHLLWLAK